MGFSPMMMIVAGAVVVGLLAAGAVIWFVLGSNKDD